MDSEYYEISEDSSRRINEVKKNGGKIFAVGTTTVRVLETVAGVFKEKFKSISIRFTCVFGGAAFYGQMLLQESCYMGSN